MTAKECHVILTCVNARTDIQEGGENVFDEKRFKAQLVLSGITATELATKLGINESTLYRKIRQDGAFTRDEINEMIKILGIRDPKDIFFADELA